MGCRHESIIGDSITFSNANNDGIETILKIQVILKMIRPIIDGKDKYSFEGGINDKR